ncbi:Apple-like protein [Cynara cardunculus var. scolymus]|uniref:Apple-like protein n=1 Tax=Cynara cardunculus var. scolymus TaxID=59895 RepID=A0A118JU86_CYNCS|nr:Apple-like protein [Cynara cardunculus var. scolymus]
MGKSWKLTSWLSDDIPDLGAFTLSWEPEGENSQKLMIQQRGKPYWTSGDLINQTTEFPLQWSNRDVGNQTFEFLDVNSPISLYQYNLSYVYNNEERYFSFHSFNGGHPMWILTPQGQFVNGGDSYINWSPNFCYGYDSGNGCVAGSNLPQCRSENDRFDLRNGDFALDIKNSYDFNSSLSISDCMVRCWNDCSCLGFITSNINNGTGCAIWTGTKSTDSFSINIQGTSLSKYVLVSSSPSKGKESYFHFKVMNSIVEERQKRDDE